MVRRPPGFTRTDTLFPYTTLFRSASRKSALVHGDVSPKNILVSASGPVFLDAECAVYGDPAFDLAFCTTHLLLKSVWSGDVRMNEAADRKSTRLNSSH